jgi:putative ABC transport system substrate-binding protein
MDRRAFITMVGGCILTVPLAARAQLSSKRIQIGILSAFSPSPREEAFRQRLRDLGYIEGRAVTIQSRYAEGRFARLPDLAAELVRLDVDVIVASPTEAIHAAQRATKTIPIVMATGGDPVGLGFVNSLAHPGGNITGLTSVAATLTAKRLEFLKAIAPAASLVWFLVNRSTPKQFTAEMEAAGRALGTQISPVLVEDAGDVDHAFAAMAKTRPGGLVVDLAVGEYYRHIADLALRHRLPAISGAGGLMALGLTIPQSSNEA